MTLQTPAKNWQILSAYDLNGYTKGSGELVGLHSQTIQAINETHTKAENNPKKLNCHGEPTTQNQKQKNLGWLHLNNPPLSTLHTKLVKGLKIYLTTSLAKGQKLIIDLWDSYNLSLYQINTLEIVQDSRNRWYACITVKEYPKTIMRNGWCGIDLGLKRQCHRLKWR